MSDQRIEVVKALTEYCSRYGEALRGVPDMLADFAIGRDEALESACFDIAHDQLEELHGGIELDDPRVQKLADELKREYTNTPAAQPTGEAGAEGPAVSEIKAMAECVHLGWIRSREEGAQQLLKAVSILAPHSGVAERVSSPRSASLSVGNPEENLFVHGSIEAIKRCQDKLWEYERLKAASPRSAEARELSLKRILENAEMLAPSIYKLLKTYVGAAYDAGAALRPSQPSEGLEQVEPDDYVAWLRFVRHGNLTIIQVCDSDSEGAFKVYRWPWLVRHFSGGKGAERLKDLQKAAELLEFMYDKWENGDPCFSDSDDSLGNALQLGDTEDEIIDVLNRLFPRNRAALSGESEGPGPRPTCPKCGCYVQLELLYPEAKGIVATCAKGCRFPLMKGLEDCWQFFRPISESNGEPKGESMAGEESGG